MAKTVRKIHSKICMLIITKQSMIMINGLEEIKITSVFTFLYSFIKCNSCVPSKKHWAN